MFSLENGMQASCEWLGRIHVDLMKLASEKLQSAQITISSLLFPILLWEGEVEVYAPMKLLVVEDEKKIANLINKGLREHGYTVDLAHNGDIGFERATTQNYDAIVLDIMLPGRDGLSVLRGIREREIHTPVILLTARGGVNDKVEGLNAGADDYLAKPFSVDELAARLRAMVRRVTGESISLYKVGELSINLITREVMRGSRKIELTAREFRLLEFLMKEPNISHSRSQIMERVWEYHFDPGTNLADAYIQRLRRKVDDGEELKMIQTVRGMGFSVVSK
jgi:two-component system, OmpR family, response regulator